MSARLTGDGAATLLDLMRLAGLSPYPETPCGGRGTCGKCRVRFSSGAPAPRPEERRALTATELADGVRLACVAVPSGEVAFSVAEAGPSRVVSAYDLSGARPLSGPARALSRPLAIAIDIGTTTIACELIDVASGDVLARDSRLNAQRRFGADVLARVRAATEGRAAELRDLVRLDALAAISALLSSAGRAGADIGLVSIAANAVMTHLLLGLSVAGFARAPFTPAATRFPALSFGEVFGPLPGSEPRASGEGSDIGADTPILVAPAVSAFVGGDVVSGLAALGIDGMNGVELFIDLGTNAEMALASGGKLYCASAAAGPAFEGGSISSGTGSVPGAVSAVSVEGNRFVWDLVGDGAEGSRSGERTPKGLCGTGLVDLVASALDLSLIARDGSLSPVCEKSGILLDPAGTVRLLASDVRELQLAKAAVRAGIETLCAVAGRGVSEITRVWIAGGFGFYLKERSALEIGLLPRETAGKIRAVGNSSLAGAALLARNSAMEARFDGILSSSEAVSLAENPLFARLFIDSMGF